MRSRKKSFFFFVGNIEKALEKRFFFFLAFQAVFFIRLQKVGTWTQNKIKIAFKDNPPGPRFCSRGRAASLPSLQECRRFRSVTRCLPDKVHTQSGSRKPTLPGPLACAHLCIHTHTHTCIHSVLSFIHAITRRRVYTVCSTYTQVRSPRRHCQTSKPS